MLVKRENLIKYSKCFIGATVTAKSQIKRSYGKGTIVNVSNNKMQIDFGAQTGIKIFQYPDSITNGMIVVDGLADIINEIDTRSIQEYRDSLINVIDKREIRSFVHYTRVSNLESILENGLCSTDYMQEHGIDFIQNDELRLDGRSDSISLSVSFPNYRYFYSLKERDEAWCVILLDPRKVIMHECAFFWTNAANTYCRNLIWEDLRGVEAFERMFAEEKRNTEIPPYYTTDPQAEIMVRNHIPADYIQFVVFKSLMDMDRNQLLCKCKCDRSLFAPRMDYMDWSRKNIDDNVFLPFDFLPFE